MDQRSLQNSGLTSSCCLFASGGKQSSAKFCFFPGPAFPLLTGSEGLSYLCWRAGHLIAVHPRGAVVRSTKKSQLALGHEAEGSDEKTHKHDDLTEAGSGRVLTNRYDFCLVYLLACFQRPNTEGSSETQKEAFLRFSFMTLKRVDQRYSRTRSESFN